MKRAIAWVVIPVVGLVALVASSVAAFAGEPEGEGGADPNAGAPPPAGQTPPPADAAAGAGGAVGQGSSWLGSVIDAAEREDQGRRTDLKGSKETYQEKLRALRGALDSLLKDLKDSRKAAPKGTQKAGEWLESWLSGRGFNANDVRNLTEALRKGNGTFKDWPINKTIESIRAARNGVTLSINDNGPRAAAGISNGHGGRAELWGKRNGGPARPAWLAARAAWTAHQDLLIGGAA